MKTLGMVTFALLIMVILTGCGATQAVKFAGSAKTTAYDCANTDVETTKAQIENEIGKYELAGLDVPADLKGALDQANACSESPSEKIAPLEGRVYPGASEAKQNYAGGPRPYGAGAGNVDGALGCTTMFCK